MITLIGYEFQDTAFTNDRGERVQLQNHFLYLTNDKAPGVTGKSCFIEKSPAQDAASVFGDFDPTANIDKRVHLEYYTNRSGKKLLCSVEAD